MSDLRTQMIRMAADLPVGDPTRRELLAAVKSAAGNPKVVGRTRSGKDVILRDLPQQTRSGRVPKRPATKFSQEHNFARVPWTRQDHTEAMKLLTQLFERVGGSEGQRALTQVSYHHDARMYATDEADVGKPHFLDGLRKTAGGTGYKLLTAVAQDKTAAIMDLHREWRNTYDKLDTASNKAYGRLLAKVGKLFAAGGWELDLSQSYLGQYHHGSDGGRMEGTLIFRDILDEPRGKQQTEDWLEAFLDYSHGLRPKGQDKWELDVTET